MLKRIIEVVVSIIIEEAENPEMYNNPNAVEVVQEYIDGVILSDCEYGIARDFKIDASNDEWIELQ